MMRPTRKITHRVALLLDPSALPSWAVTRHHQDPVCAFPHDTPVPATFDVKVNGHWRYACTGHFRAHGNGLGPNVGTRLVTDGTTDRGGETDAPAGVTPCIPGH